MQSRYLIGRFEFRPDLRQIHHDGQVTTIGGRACDLLLALIERRDRVVSSDELDRLVWPGLSVEPNNLKVQIWALRKLLGAPAIITVPRRGYRFVAQVSIDSDEPAPSAIAPRQGRALAPRPAAGGTDPIGDRVVELLQTHRLVTVVGEHEPSRRRTAEASSRRVLHTSHDSVFWLDAIDLAKGNPSPGHVVRNDDDAQSGRGHPGWPLLQRLGNQDAVVVVFNCQRAPEIANRFIDAALEGTPRVRVLATAQRALGRSGEQVVTVPKAAEVEFARIRGSGR